ncbi:MAG: IS1595 family transposase [Afipia sp.]|nr:IS1595 family transposase [Afipia sp.]
MSQFNAKHFQTPEAARAYLEALRWGSERVCPHCGTINSSYATKKPGVYRCASKECRKDFSVTTKSVMESSHIKLHIWLQAFYLMASSKKGVSSHQLHRALGVTYKTAWFLSHRIREAMRNGGIVSPMGGEGAIVEADETYFGNVSKDKIRKTTTTGRPFTKSGKSGPSNKRAIVSLVERGGSVRSFHVAVADGASVRKIVMDNVSRETRLHTDESKLYHGADAHFAMHETVNHSRKEYARGDVTTNSVEGYFSIFKRGMRGVYQHCAEKHLHRYLSEYDFRYNHRIKLGFNDGERADLAIKGAAGKRLTYRQAN